uniref:Uncharacterized protein n=1 Tax=Helicotheca tamesis TaxID=374047 RepID=A0A7S2MYV3_9STRA|mmetsp:Transcript_6059/g.8282  ORF Transcript_6059/g.8282 Transcript_6059/m.8282 type:complete len:211 (+) Transcript_6059:91-723(+)|eukprot:CAMPEP_0185729892 /NCGR_PEP_ID=MMETSP1171-20130828/7728_1 /TAXON_ID=374046 /ORGANISM="Helicotheca tamensis, Strain CCMP826" /LENGTH=210 /DNA_ID=CAMNT_0028398831 /DNA_START=38 /DNA_END=670 /DNA_ORIENTATION=-
MSDPQNEINNSSSSSSSSSSRPGGLSGWLFGRDNFLGRFANEQRLERLQNCQNIELALQSCERRREAALRGENISVDELDKTGDEKKIERYYGWDEMGGRHSPRPEEDSTITNPGGENGNIKVPTCARESHAVWACRALALGCAVDMMKLKECFDKSQQDVLKVSRTEYEANGEVNSKSQSDETAICGLEQRNLGACVRDNAHHLQRRVN